jgi:hypothetical protein
MIDRFDVSCLANFESGRYVLYEDHLAEIKKLEGWLKALWFTAQNEWVEVEVLQEISDYIKAMEGK